MPGGTCYNLVRMILPDLDISTAVQAAFVFSILGVLITFLMGIRSYRAGRKLTFFRKRMVLIERGYRLIAFSFLLAGLAFFLNRYAEPAVYTIYPPSPTITETATVTQTSTITLTSTITPTATITPTLSITPTPYIPTDIYLQFTSVVTPNPQAIFSKPQVAREINKDRLAVDPASEFANPVGKLYAAFSYDKMTDKAQWTALWMRLADKKVVCFESSPWTGSTGGYGYSECAPSSEQWMAGDYEISLFAGTTFKVSTYFKITGSPPTPVGTLTPTRPLTTMTPTPPPGTIAPSNTVTPSITVTPPLPSITPSFTNSPVPPLPTWTPWPTDTRWPSMTPTR
jgi:hypothetical protein